LQVLFFDPGEFALLNLYDFGGTVVWVDESFANFKFHVEEFPSETTILPRVSP
jgi:hypothetical protein